MQIHKRAANTTQHNRLEKCTAHTENNNGTVTAERSLDLDTVYMLD